MSPLIDLSAPIIISCVCIYASSQGVDIYSAMISGAAKGLKVVAEILPAMVLLFSIIYLLQASGLPEIMVKLLAPAARLLGIPQDTVLLMFLRPVSGSGALSAASDIIARNGADSLTGRTAAVMMGASETTLYVTGLYFSAAGVRGSRWTIPAALCADFACFLSAAWICALLWG